MHEWRHGGGLMFHSRCRPPSHKTLTEKVSISLMDIDVQSVTKVNVPFSDCVPWSRWHQVSVRPCVKDLICAGKWILFYTSYHIHDNKYWLLIPGLQVIVQASLYRHIDNMSRHSDSEFWHQKSSWASSDGVILVSSQDLRFQSKVTFRWRRLLRIASRRYRRHDL